MRRATYRSSFAVLNATLLAFLMVAVVRAPAAQNGKSLTQQEVLQLLEGGVQSARVSSIIDDRGINFRLNDEIEQKVRDAGGADDVVAALRRASQRLAETERPRTGGLIIKTTPGETQIYLNDEPKGMTSPEGEIRLPDLQPGSYRLRVSLPGYKSYEEPMPVTAGEDQTVYVTLVQRSATLQRNIPVPDQLPPSSGLSIPGIKIAPLQFFEGPHDKTLEKSERVYLSSFDHTAAKSIFWELDLTYPSPGQRIDFTLDAIWYKPDGSELRHQTLAAYVMPTWKNSWHTLGYGWVDAGHWPSGTYRVEILFKGVHISNGSFQIY
jgi:hypothetical protein